VTLIISPHSIRPYQTDGGGTRLQRLIHTLPYYRIFP